MWLIRSRRHSISLAKRLVQGRWPSLSSMPLAASSWAPWSKEFGRWPILQTPLGLVNLWQIPCALTPNENHHRMPRPRWHFICGRFRNAGHVSQLRVYISSSICCDDLLYMFPEGSKTPTVWYSYQLTFGGNADAVNLKWLIYGSLIISSTQWLMLSSLR